MRTASVVGASTIARDITAQKRDVERLRESEARLRSIVDAAVDGIIVIDAHGRIEAFNPGAERLFGYRAAEVIGVNVSILMPQPYRDEHDGYMAQVPRRRASRASSASAAKSRRCARTAARFPCTCPSARCRWTASASSRASCTT